MTINRATVEALDVTVNDAISHSACHWCPSETNTSNVCRARARYTFTASRPARTANACEEHATSVAGVIARGAA